MHIFVCGDQASVGWNNATVQRRAHKQYDTTVSKPEPETIHRQETDCRWRTVEGVVNKEAKRGTIDRLNTVHGTCTPDAPLIGSLCVLSAFLASVTG